MEKTELIERSGSPEYAVPKREHALARYIKAQLLREPERKKLTVSQHAKRGLICFFAVMLALTFLSRAASEALLAKVTVKNISSGTIDQSISGKGTWTAANTRQQRPEYEGLRVEQVFVQQGMEVREGDALYSYALSSIQAAQAELSLKIEQYKLQIKQLKTGQSDSAQSAAFALDQAKEELQEAQQKLDHAASQLASEKRKAYEDALSAHQSQAARRDAEVAAAEQEVAAAEAALDPSDPATQAALDAAKAALTKLLKNWESQLGESLQKVEQAESDWRRVKNGTYDVTLELAAYHDAISAAERAVEAAQFDYTQAQKNDSNANKNIAYQIDGIELMMEQEQQRYDALSALLKQDGIVYSSLSGIVTAVDVSAGSLTTAQTAVTLATDGLVFQIELPSDKAQNIVVGDTVTLMKDGKEQKEKLTVSEIGAPDASGIRRLACVSKNQDFQATFGGTQEFIIEKKTAKQSIRIPIEALREDGSDKYYVLTLGEQETVLGMQTIAVRVDVTLLFHDEQYAAVDGALSSGDQIILNSNKYIKANDRVVIRND